MILDKGPTPLYHQLKNILESKIRSRELKERERLPSEAELCSEFGVSRITVHQPLSELLKDSLIYRERGKGAYIAKGAGWKRPVLKGSIENLTAAGAGPLIKVLSYKEVVAPKEFSKALTGRKPEKVYRLETTR